ncbi:hypothetical protein HZS_332 [Henneguya salminicola]|nr:hypothetical protein HZS_332 [Henneguya salminicola]
MVMTRCFIFLILITLKSEIIEFCNDRYTKLMNIYAFCIDFLYTLYKMQDFKDVDHINYSLRFNLPLRY